MSIIATEIWSDLHQSLITDVQGSIKKSINTESIKTSIDNILRTSKGERVMLRDFGSNLKGMLFENINNSLTNIISDEIKNAINTWDDRVIVNAIDFKTYADENQVVITIKFAVRGYNDIFSMSLTL